MIAERLLIRAHGGPVAGAGHVMRCLALAEAWAERGGAVSFAVGEGLGALEDRLAATGEVVGIAAPPGSEADLEATRNLALRADAVAIAVDGYVFDEAFYAGVGSLLPVLAVDDEPRCARYPVDLLLNQNLHATSDAYAGRAPGARLLLGPRYALIRREFRAVGARKENPGPVCRVLVTLGGADPTNVTRTAIRALDGLGGLNVSVKVIVGPLNARANELAELAATVGDNVEVCAAPPDLPALMAWADFAISAAGSTTWELLHLGVPMLLVTLADNQRAIADSLVRAGVARGLGWHLDVTAPAIAAAVGELIRDSGARAEMAGRGRAMVDGAGAARVAEEIATVVASPKAAR